MANFGPHGRGNEELRDWLLGGNRKRRILESLAEAPDGGWSAELLARELDCGPATVYETFRALRGAGLLETIKPRRYRMAAGTDLADALQALIVVLKVEGAQGVARPPRTRR
jgi:DNA-binding transcriptional ArsR family regulator